MSALQRQADVWDSQKRPSHQLLRDETLLEAERWAAEHDDELTAGERDYLAACREARSIAERERRQARRIRIWAIAAQLSS